MNWVHVRYLLDKIIPSILKMSSEEEAGAALVGWVGASPTQTNQEHGASSFNLFGPWSQESTQITLKLFLVWIGCAFICTVDEDSSLVVGRWSLV